MRNNIFTLLITVLFLSNTFAYSKPIDAGDQVKIALAKQKFLGGQVVEALNLYKEVLVKNPNDPMVLHYVGVCHFTLKDYDKALEHLVTAKESKDVKYEPMLYLGKIYQLKSKSDDVLTLYESYKVHATAKEPDI